MPPGENNVVTLNVKGVLVYAFCIVVVFVASGLLKFFAMPYIQVIDCDDVSIRKRYKGDSVTGPQIVIYVIMITAIVILATECILHFSSCKNSLPLYQLGCLKFNNLVYNSFKYFFGYFYGFSCYFVVACVMKITTGRLRPNFIDVCNPDPYSFGCSPNQSNKYTEQYECRGDPAQVKDARESFPSLHAASAVGTALYICIFLHYKISNTTLHPFRTLTQLCFVVLATYVSVQRVNDHAHHETDVIAGIIIGVLGSLYTVHCIVNWFQDNNLPLPPPPTPIKEELMKGSIYGSISDIHQEASAPT